MSDPISIDLVKNTGVGPRISGGDGGALAIPRTFHSAATKKNATERLRKIINGQFSVVEVFDISSNGAMPLKVRAIDTTGKVFRISYKLWSQSAICSK